MFKKIIATVALTSLGAVNAFGDDPMKTYKTEIRQAESLGAEIYSQDIAAWVATDSLLAFMDQNKNFEANRLGGWVSYKEGAKYKTVFITRDVEDPRVLYEAYSRERDVKKADQTDRSLSEREAGLWKARNLMLEQDFEVCTEYMPYNSIVLEKKAGGYYGYLFAATKEHNVIVLGRHYRFEINADATQVSETHLFSNSCFALPAVVPETGEKPLMLTATHLVTNYPQEHHIFANLMWNIPLAIGASKTGQNYLVENGKIKPLK